MKDFQLDPKRIPQHVAIIMDGNGRWAKRKGELRIFGHTNGVDSALGVLKKIERERNKNIFLISHRDELVGRVNTILQVIKEGGFTTFSTDTEFVDAS